MPSFLSHPDFPRLLAAIAAALAAAGLLAAGASLLWSRRARGAAGLDRALGRLVARSAGATDGAEPPDPPPAPARGPARLLQREGGPLDRWLGSRFGALLVADEDRRLMSRCGYRMRPAQRAYLVARVGAAVLAALAGGASGAPGGFAVAAAAAAGFMAPKWFLRRQARRRARRADAELPLLVDVVRLLQGVGLGLDQSLQVAAAEFASAMPVLAAELAAANRQYARGRTREQSLQRLSTVFADERMASLVALLVQADRHGGALQEPLGRFGDRLRERRRAELKARIGRISVKMTGIMVCTLLPALLIVAAGPGLVAIARSLGAMAR